MTEPPLPGAVTTEFRQGWPTLLAATLGCAAGLSSLPFYSLGSFIVPLQAEFGWGRGEIASSFLYTTVVLAVISPLLGTLVDRIGVRPIALVAIPLLAAMTITRPNQVWCMPSATGSIRRPWRSGRSGPQRGIAKPGRQIPNQQFCRSRTRPASWRSASLRRCRMATAFTPCSPRSHT